MALQAILMTTVYAGSTEFFLSDKDLRRRFQSIAFGLTSVIQDAIRDMGVGGGKSAALVAEPSMSVKRAYFALFGVSSFKDIHQRFPLAGLTESELTVALSGAAAWNDIFIASALPPLCFRVFGVLCTGATKYQLALSGLWKAA